MQATSKIEKVSVKEILQMMEADKDLVKKYDLTFFLVDSKTTLIYLCDINNIGTLPEDTCGTLIEKRTEQGRIIWTYAIKY